MRLKRTSILVAAIAGLLFSPMAALACACCSNTGHYFSGSVDLDEHPLSELKRLRFARTAFLFSTEAGIEEDSLGIDQPKESYLL